MHRSCEEAKIKNCGEASKQFDSKAAVTFKGQGSFGTLNLHAPDASGNAGLSYAHRDTVSLLHLRNLMV
jgi:hypothetical protein